MESKVFYKSSVARDLKRIGRRQCEKIMNRIEADLKKNSGQGKRLKGEFDGLFSLRVGDYRIIYTNIRDGILILRIAHRKEVYRS